MQRVEGRRRRRSVGSQRCRGGIRSPLPLRGRVRVRGSPMQPDSRRATLPDGRPTRPPRSVLKPRVRFAMVAANMKPPFFHAVVLAACVHRCSAGAGRARRRSPAQPLQPVAGSGHQGSGPHPSAHAVGHAGQHQPARPAQPDLPHDRETAGRVPWKVLRSFATKRSRDLSILVARSMFISRTMSSAYSIPPSLGTVPASSMASIRRCL